VPFFLPKFHPRFGTSLPSQRGESAVSAVPPGGFRQQNGVELSGIQFVGHLEELEQYLFRSSSGGVLWASGLVANRFWKTFPWVPICGCTESLELLVSDLIGSTMIETEPSR
jgi:hypothetical protein